MTTLYRFVVPIPQDMGGLAHLPHPPGPGEWRLVGFIKVNGNDPATTYGHNVTGWDLMWCDPDDKTGLNLLCTTPHIAYQE